MLAAGQTAAEETDASSSGMKETPADLGTVRVEGDALSRYRPETVNGATFTDVPPEKLPVVVDTLTEDFIREHNPTDFHDLMRFVPGIESGGKSLLIRQPGTFMIRGMGGTDPMIDGVLPVGRGAGLFMEPFLLDRVEIVKGPIASLNGGSGGSQNADGGGGSINMYIKSARLDRDSTVLQANTSVGRRLLRQRGMFDTNETMLGGKAAFRLVGTADYYDMPHINQGFQKGARPRESFSIAPSFVFAPSDELRFGLKTMFQYTDQPSYIGVPVYRGHPGGGWRWYDSSASRGDRTKYEGFMVNPWADWQVTENWLLKFGASLMVVSWSQDTMEPATGNLDYYNTHGYWTWGPEPRHGYTQFGHSRQFSRNYSLFVRSIYDSSLPYGVENSLVVQPDFYYRESNGSFGNPVSRYGLTLQDSVSWGWIALLGGLRYDHFESEAYTAETSGNRFRHATMDSVSPRAGISVQPVDWLVFFGNISQTRTPLFGVASVDGAGPSKPWRSTQYEGGARVRAAEKLWLTVSTYRIEQENKPEFNNAGLITDYDGRCTSRGAELSLAGDISPNWTVMAMYSFMKYTNRNVAPGKKGRDFERTPAHTFSLNTSYRFAGGMLDGVAVGCGYRFRSKSYGTLRGNYQKENLFLSPSHVFDVNMSMPLSKFGGPAEWTLTLGVRNLFGEKYFESTRHYYECLAGEPRTFELGIRAEF